MTRLIAPKPGKKAPKKPVKKPAKKPAKKPENKDPVAEIKKLKVGDAYYLRSDRSIERLGKDLFLYNDQGLYYREMNLANTIKFLKDEPYKAIREYDEKTRLKEEGDGNLEYDDSEWAYELDYDEVEEAMPKGDFPVYIHFGREYQGEELGEFPPFIEFDSKKEREAFMKGVDMSLGWMSAYLFEVDVDKKKNKVKISYSKYEP